MIAPSVDSYKLIDNSVATISIAGSTPWLSLLRGKNTIIFGDHWVSGCNSVYTINSSGELKNILSKLSKDSKIDQLDVLKYAQSIYDSTYENLRVAGGRTDKYYGQIYKADSYNDTEVKRICDAIYHYYNLNYLK